ncbi:Defensin-7 [Myotis davidii]|uniref:Defensin-7 n=1 Tax=Myotis davidii TaxID=225400 RepID=L5LP09_MYODS|nr:Defensin-7 [Myotis davidii]
MRTLTLLAALLLLALQAQAQTLQETADQVPAQDQPEAKDQGELWSEDEDEAEDGDQDVAISFTGEERLARAAAVLSMSFVDRDLKHHQMPLKTGKRFMHVVPLCRDFCADQSTAQARTLQETDDQVPAQDQPEAKDQGELWSEDEDQTKDGDQDVAISFTGEERLARAAEPGKIKIKRCRCRRNCRVTILGEVLERVSGVCKFLGRRRKLCCQ